MNNNRNRFKRRSSKNTKTSDLNPELLVKKASGSKADPYVSKRRFKNFDLHPLILKNVEFKGYDRPTEIQDRCIEKLSRGRNIVGIAATGTGKTGAFLIPILQQMLTKRGTTALVVVPTRELAQQVLSEFKSLSKGTNLQSACFIGGTSVNKDLSIAKRSLDLIVGTPGRLLDLTQRGALRINNVPILVLDEFDRMLDMGFIRDIQKIVSMLKARKQTMLFSATLNSSQEKIIDGLVKKPMRVNVTAGNKSSDNVDQNIIRVGENENKFEILLDLISEDSFEKVILFAETKRTVNKLSKQLSSKGVRSDVIHGNKSQNYRTKAIRLFKAGKTRVLVATDVAARGIDIEGVTHVINYQLPQNMDSYIHRIGRTGRAERSGIAYTFVN